MIITIYHTNTIHLIWETKNVRQRPTLFDSGCVEYQTKKNCEWAHHHSFYWNLNCPQLLLLFMMCPPKLQKRQYACSFVFMQANVSCLFNQEITYCWFFSFWYDGLKFLVVMIIHNNVILKSCTLMLTVWNLNPNWNPLTHLSAYHTLLFLMYTDISSCCLF